jgi:hypothetical protein
MNEASAPSSLRRRLDLTGDLPEGDLRQSVAVEKGLRVLCPYNAAMNPESVGLFLVEYRGVQPPRS